jgi:putative transcriptional regulator
MDKEYKRSVIFIVEHNHEGSVGIIINKLSNMNVNMALNELSVADPLLYGGPFNKRLIVFLHNQPQIPDSVYMSNDIFLGGDYESLKDLLYMNKVDLHKIRFCAGCVEWAPGQLESEISQDKWWTSEISAHEYFTTNADMLWSYKLITDGHLYGLFEECPDPSMN